MQNPQPSRSQVFEDLLAAFVVEVPDAPAHLGDVTALRGFAAASGIHFLAALGILHAGVDSVRSLRAACGVGDTRPRPYKLGTIVRAVEPPAERERVTIETLAELFSRLDVDGAGLFDGYDAVRRLAIRLGVPFASLAMLATASPSELRKSVRFRRRAQG